MKKLEFYDLGKKKKFSSGNYKLKAKDTKRGKRYFAVTKSEWGNDCWRVISKDTYKDLK
jgi:hypothetical protein